MKSESNSSPQTDVDYKGIFNSGSVKYLILLPNVPKFTIVGASDVYLESTMRNREDIVGKGVFEAFPPNPNDVDGIMEQTFRAAFARVMETKKVDVMPVQQYDIPKPGGGFEVRYWSVTHNPILDGRGQLVQMAQRVEDVTELVHLKQQGDRLETEVMLRAREIKDASNKLADANKELAAFSYSLTHDLQAPLRRMISFCEILLKEHQTTLNSEGQDYLQRVIASARRMRLLIDGMLSFARLSRDDVRRENVDLTLLARNMFEQLAAAEPSRKVEFVVDEGMKAHGDSRLLELVLQNLIGNAWKFSSKKDLAKIEVGKLTKNEKTVFFVKDNGAGFDMEYVDKLFGAFKRLHSEQDFAGTGIGLATVKKIIQRHGGSIWAESVHGEGATFFFTIL